MTRAVIKPTPTAEELAKMQRRKPINDVTFFRSCTVYDDPLLEVHLRHGNADIIFWSTIHFHYLSHLLDFQTKNTHDVIITSIGDSASEELLQQNAELQRIDRPNLFSVTTGLPPGSLQQVVLGSATKSSLCLCAFHLLHHCYVVNLLVIHFLCAKSL